MYGKTTVVFDLTPAGTRGQCASCNERPVSAWDVDCASSFAPTPWCSRFVPEFPGYSQGLQDLGIQNPAMNTFGEDTLYLALDKIADVDAIAGANLNKRLMPVRVELRANVFAIQAHYGNARREYVESASGRIPGDIEAQPHAAAKISGLRSARVTFFPVTCSMAGQYSASIATSFLIQ